MYSYEEAYAASLEYFKGDELATSVFLGKYALQDEEGNYLELNPDDMHKRLAKEFASFGITVNAIGPTPIKTDLIKSVPDEKIKKLINAQAIKRFGSFKDTVNVIDFFINEKSDFITGQIIYLGGI